MGYSRMPLNDPRNDSKPIRHNVSEFKNDTCYLVLFVKRNLKRKRLHYSPYVE